MRAANTAGSAAATQPAAKPRLKRAMKAHLVKLWRLVGEAGSEGITVEALVQQLPDAQPKQVSTALSYMRTLDYVSTSGARGRAQGGRWWVTGVPVGQQPPEWMRKAEMPRQATSVFALAAAPVPADWTLKGRRTPPPAGAKLLDDDDDDDDQAEGVDIDAAHTRPKPGSTASELGWVAPTVVTTATEPPPYEAGRPAGAAEVVGQVGHVSAPAYGFAFAPTTPPPLFHEPSSDELRNHFALHSDGTLHLCVEGGGRSVDVLLQPSTTRALFRWLDRLGGTHLSRTMEAA